MKILLLAMMVLTSLSSVASEYDRRNAINEARLQELARAGRERARADSEAAYIEAIAASLCLDPSGVTGRYGDWTTTDGSIACGVADGGFGGAYIRCLDTNGTDVGGYYVEKGKMVSRGSCHKAKRKR